MSGYEFVKEGDCNIDKCGIRIKKNENQETMFFGKAIFRYNGERYRGKYHPEHGTCYIAVGGQEFPENINLEILQSKS